MLQRIQRTCDEDWITNAESVLEGLEVAAWPKSFVIIQNADGEYLNEV